MLLKVLDGQGQAQTIITAGQETIADRSASIIAADAQNVMEENDSRSGYYFKNPEGNDDMYINDVAEAYADASQNFKVPAGGSWPPPGYPVTTRAISVIGTIGQDFIAREW